MKNKVLLWMLALMIMLAGCRQTNHSENQNAESTLSFSEAFKPAFFESDQRREKVKALAPEIQQLIEDHCQSKHIPGIAYGLVVDDELVVEGATGYIDLDRQRPANTKSDYRIASMTKSFTAMAILKLRDEGRISLEDPVQKYIPEMGGLEYLTRDAPLIDINNLLTMTAGFPEDNPWGDRQLDEPDTMLMNLMLNGVSFSNVPSYQFEYSNTGYALLGHIVTEVSGMPYQKYISEKILAPLGMNETYWEFDSIPQNQLALGYRWEDEKWIPEPMLHDGSYGAMGGLITTIQDFSKYVSFHLSAWPPRNEEDNGPVKRSSLREMHTPQFTGLYSKATDWDDEPCAVMAGYGFGLGISTNCNGIKRISHGGALPGFGSNYVFFPEYGVGLMAFCNLTYTSPWPIDEIEKLLFESAELKARTLPASDILKERQKQLVELIRHWDPELESNILAENFYLDKAREKRIEEIDGIMKKAGLIQQIEPVKPRNQLRGSFEIKTEHGTVNLFFTLTPEKDPKVQQLNISFEDLSN